MTWHSVAVWITCGFFIAIAIGAYIALWIAIIRGAMETRSLKKSLDDGTYPRRQS